MTISIIILSILFLFSTKTLVNKLSSKFNLSIKITRIIFILFWLFKFAIAGFIINYIGGVIAWAFTTAVLSSIALGFVAIWSLFSNITSILILLGFKQISIGDYIEILEAKDHTIKGKVEDINLFFITLKESETSRVRVPNNFFFQKSVRLLEEEIEIIFDE